ncbi:hypothetical protein [Staphylococcus aureus]|uniref:hypothetical protein n=1 Tax=Staphylococcus aureus TaxID=1280 RepID=UPI0016651E2E|nr:hypothetical protein [Staphylococcus aureus]
MQFKKSVSLRKVLVISLSFLTILSMVLNFNFKEAQAQNKNNIADKNIETLNEKEIEKELDYIYGKIIVLDKDGTAKDVNLENAKSRYGYVPEGFQKLKNDIENKKKNSSISPRAVGGNYKNSNDCFYSEVLNSYGELLTGNIIAAVFDDVKAKNIKSAAKKLARIGIKGNLAGIAATMVSKDVQCTLKYGWF